MAIEYETPTNLHQLLIVLEEIYSYYNYRKDEYTPIELEKMVLDRVNIIEKTDQELYEDATKELYVKHVQERNERKMELKDRLIKLNAEKYRYKKAKKDDDQKAQNDYFDAIIKYGSTGANRGLDFASGLTGSVLDLKTALDNKLNENLLVYNEAVKYIDEEIALTIQNIATLDEYSSFLEERDILAKAQELKKKQTELNNDLLRYNNSLSEKEIRVNNAVATAESKNNLEYMSIVCKGLTENELSLKGYYKEVMTLLMNYYYAKTDKINAYEEFCGQPSFIEYLGPNYESLHYLLFARAYPDKVQI